MEEDYTEGTDELNIEDGEVSTSEEAFMKGYHEEGEIEECAECGVAIDEGKGISKDVAGEVFTFCSKECQGEFEEGIVE